MKSHLQTLDELIDDISEHLKEIRRSKERYLSHALSVGQCLILAKPRVTGRFDDWCRATFQIEKTARSDYMALAKAKNDGTLDRVLNGAKIEEFDGGLKELVKKSRGEDIFKKIQHICAMQESNRKCLEQAYDNIGRLAASAGDARAADYLVDVAWQSAVTSQHFVRRLRGLAIRAKRQTSTEKKLNTAITCSGSFGDGSDDSVSTSTNKTKTKTSWRDA